MSRLTYKNYIDEWECKFEKNSETQWSVAESDTHIKITGSPIDKLAKFEDFMEKNEWDSVEEMDTALKECEQKYFKVWHENQSLKNIWNKLKEWLSVKWFAENADLNLGDVIKKIKELEKEN